MAKHCETKLEHPPLRRIRSLLDENLDPVLVEQRSIYEMGIYVHVDVDVHLPLVLVVNQSCGIGRIDPIFDMNEFSNALQAIIDADHDPVPLQSCFLLSFFKLGPFS